MKQSFYLKIALFFLFKHTLWGQTTSYQPMLATNNTWHVLRQLLPTEPIKTQYYLTTGDTLLAGKNYKKIAIDYLGLRQEIGGLREETATKKIYFRDFPTNTEFVMYDFSLSVGNQFEAKEYDINSGLCCISKFIRLDSIKSLPLNTLNRVYYFSQQGTSNKVVWVEGVGSLAGIMYAGSAPIVNTVGELNCAQKNTLFTYRSNYYFNNGNQCTLLIGNDKVSETAYQVELFPNPLHTAIMHIQTDAPDITTAELYSVLGEKIKTYHLDSQYTDLNMATLPAGIYYVRLYDSQYTTLFVKKILKL